MAITTTIPTKLKKSQVTNTSQQLKFDSDTLMGLLVIAGSGIPDTSSTGIQFVQDVFSGGNTEVTGSGYARQTLAGVTVAFATSTSVSLTFSNITFLQNAAGVTTARYLILYDATIGSGDSTHPVWAVVDPNAVQSTVTGDIIFQCPAGGLIVWP